MPRTMLAPIAKREVHEAVPQPLPWSAAEGRATWQAYGLLLLHALLQDCVHTLPQLEQGKLGTDLWLQDKHRVEITQPAVHRHLPAKSRLGRALVFHHEVNVHHADAILLMSWNLLLGLLVEDIALAPINIQDYDIALVGYLRR